MLKTELNAAAILVALAAHVAAGQSLRTTDGRRIEGTLIALTAATASVEAKEGRQDIPLAQVDAISLAAEAHPGPADRKGQHLLRTADGGLLPVRDVAVHGGTLEAASGIAGRLAVPLERITRLLRPGPAETPAQLESELRPFASPAKKEDTLVVRAPGGKWAAMSGFLNSLGAGKVSFTYEGAETTMKDDPVAAVFLAGAKTAEGPAPAGLVIGTDGSRIPFRTIRLDAKGFVVEGVALGGLRLGVGAVAEVRFRQEAAIYLSDLVPAEAAETPFFDDESPWQRDRSAAGRRLRIAEATYEKGLGLHARCRLVYELGGRYARLTAVAGIDGDLRSGRALLTITADGKPLVEGLLVDRTRPPHRVDLDLRGVRRLEAVVDFAEGTFGSGARVNLCDAVLTPSAHPAP